MCRIEYYCCPGCSSIGTYDFPCSEFNLRLYRSPQDKAWIKEHCKRDNSKINHEIHYSVCLREECQAKYEWMDSNAIKHESIVDGSLKGLLFIVETSCIRGVVTVKKTEDGNVIQERWKP